MKLLVTGGAGFIGSNFIHYWLKKYPKDFIINIDALKYSGNLENHTDIEKNPNYKFVKVDIAKANDVETVVKQGGIDVIVNFAAQTHVDRALYYSYEFIESNVIGVKNLLEAAKLHGVKRYHQISTDEVYGDLPLFSKEKFKETTPLLPRNEYAATKAAAEHLVMAYFHTHKLPVTISNCTNNIGPNQYPEKFLPLAITNILEGKKVPLYGSGKYVRDWLYVLDHCRGIDLVIHKGKVGESYIMGSDHTEITNIALLKLLLKQMGRGEDLIEHVTDRPGHDRKYAVDWSKIKKLGWRPIYSLEESLNLTVKWYTENPSWWKKIKSGEFRKHFEITYKKAND
ncbi:dTDP-glucose 4,6-dehydratase [Candidatus Gottesmanbacteria bacterium RIFCSPHIGHO2_01_FULL_42_12]|uniref:dTDP-glucose 4,6-dehydratase n=1 Tax=Candidatus Gottesmanbacteria bacterium RIFCSPHIGHO2_01_FULL_42_12 TaxID=1798377 RepID=A0A1F5Z3R0_9BACT|nr:MAG: dTDP-glucose 4,6-dehydratase [Candidatus Gottesmanbacteria bacterium RIFCSPHIGHO2_01_FULL_42_12]